MKIVINILLVIVIIGLGYLLVTGITEPIEFRAEKDARMNRVVDRLREIRTSQEMYRDITGEFADNFDTLIHVLKNDSIPFQQVFGDPDDPENTERFVYRTIYFNANDSIQSLGINLDSLRYVPFAPSGTEFSIDADTMTYQQTLVSVTEVGTRWKNFMGKFGDPRFTKYDDSYNPDAMLKFGNMNTPNLSGNWE